MKNIVMLLCVLLVLVGCAHQPPMVICYLPEVEEPAAMHVYFGTYTKDREEGIYQGLLDTETGELEIVGGVGGVTNPSFLGIHPNQQFLYAVAESGKNDGASAFAIDPDTGGLTLLNTQTTSGRGACHVGLDPAGTTAVVSYYSSGQVASFPINDDGTLGPAASLIQHEGSGAHPGRQKGPHAHSTNVDATGRFAVAADLGTDELYIYQLDAQAGALTPHEPATFDLQPGAGPRHLAFHPSGEFAYVINELDMTMTAMRWDAQAGTLTELQRVSTLPAEGYEGTQSTAEVVVHPSGKFVYGSNRGPDTLVIYAVDQERGTLSLVGFEPTGDEPRNFNIDPTGRWLITCHQNSDDVQVFSIDVETGELTPVGDPVAVPMPVCVKFLPVS